MTRNGLFEIVETRRNRNRAGRCYEWFMLLVIMLSITPLMFVGNYTVFYYTEWATTGVFVLDYLVRWALADLKLKRGAWSFLLYPFTLMAVIDLLSILPIVNLIDPAFKIFRISRMVKIVRLFKLSRYSSKISIFFVVLKKEQSVLLSVLVVALFYIYLTALIMFNAEPHTNPVTGQPTFNSFFDALYWATVTLTTVGYGDLCPVTNLGRCISMLSSLFGVAIIALPSGVITASYIDELHKKRTGHGDEEEGNVTTGD